MVVHQDKWKKQAVWHVASRELVYLQGRMTVLGIIHMYVCILYLRCEDAIVTILCMGLPIITITTGKWLNS